MSSKSPATSLATATLFATGALSDAFFLSLHSWLGAGAFGVFAVVAAAGGLYVARAVPETKGRTLEEIQKLLRPGNAALQMTSSSSLRLEP